MSTRWTAESSALRAGRVQNATGGRPAASKICFSRLRLMSPVSSTAIRAWSSPVGSGSRWATARASGSSRFRSVTTKGRLPTIRGVRGSSDSSVCHQGSVSDSTGHGTTATAALPS